MTELSAIKIKVSSAFDKIGKTNGTANPDPISNLAPIAHELFIAYTLSSMAEKRKELAKVAAQNAGIVLEDPVPDTTKTTYENDHMLVIAKTNKASQSLDATMLKNELTKRFGETVATEIIAKSQKPKKAATTYSFSER